VKTCSNLTTQVGINCVSKASCSGACLTCSLTPSFCLSCKADTPTPILNLQNGSCVENNLNACPKGYFVDQKLKSCRKCSSTCKDCEFGESNCVSCWEFLGSNLVDWKSFTCVKSCSNGTYYNETTKDCPLCNPVC
jgi:proprotein convertase subtilisin/kexin type 5